MNWQMNFAGDLSTDRIKRESRLLSHKYSKSGREISPGVNRRPNVKKDSCKARPLYSPYKVGNLILPE